MNRKFKLSYFYTQKFKNKEIELTYDLFYKMFHDCESEFVFYYKDYIIFTAFHYENNTLRYELNIQKNELTENYQFDSCDELINAKVINGFSIIQLWNDLSN